MIKKEENFINCKTCNKNKLVSEFRKHKTNKSRLDYTCKRCRTEQNMHNQCFTTRGRSNRIFCDCQKACRKNGWKINIDINWIESKIKNKYCEATGIEFVISKKNPWMPSIDRINPRLGYTKENCQMVVWIYNTAKQEFTHEDVIKLSKAILKNE